MSSFSVAVVFVLLVVSEVEVLILVESFRYKSGAPSSVSTIWCPQQIFNVNFRRFSSTRTMSAVDVPALSNEEMRALGNVLANCVARGRLQPASPAVSAVLMAVPIAELVARLRVSMANGEWR